MIGNETVLLDNATISSAFRALGFATCANRSVFDLDLANLSTLVDSVLFSDNVIVPANYIEKYEKERADLLSIVGINLLDVSKDDNQIIEAIASKVFSRWTMDYREDEGGLARDLLKLTDVYMRFVWSYRSSEYWLLLRAFAGYEGACTNKLPLIESLLTEPNAHWDELDLLKSSNIFSTDGTIVKDVNLKDSFVIRPGVRKLMAGLAWNVHRAIYYRILSAKENAIYLPHSLRAIGATLDAISSKDSPVDSSTLAKYNIGQSRKTITDSFELIMKRTGEELVSIGAIDSTTCSMPPLLSYIIKKSDSRESFLEQLACIKERSCLQNLRGNLREFETNVQKGDISGICKWRREVDRTCSSVIKEMGLCESAVTLNPLSYITGGIVTYDSRGVAVPAWLNRIIGLPSNWKIWYREVAMTLQNVAQMGETYDKIKSWANFKDDETPNWYAKFDYPKKYTKVLDEGVVKSHVPSNEYLLQKLKKL